MNKSKAQKNCYTITQECMCSCTDVFVRICRKVPKYLDKKHYLQERGSWWETFYSTTFLNFKNLNDVTVITFQN